MRNKTWIGQLEGETWMRKHEGRGECLEIKVCGVWSETLSEAEGVLRGSLQRQFGARLWSANEITYGKELCKRQSSTEIWENTITIAETMVVAIEIIFDLGLCYFFLRKGVWRSLLWIALPHVLSPVAIFLSVTSFQPSLVQMVKLGKNFKALLSTSFKGSSSL